MATTAKLVTDLSVTLRGMRSHEGVVADHASQAASTAVADHLKKVAAREQVVTDRAARALGDLGGAAPRLRPSWVPSPTSVVAAVTTRAQPLGEALVLEATALRMLSDRARVVHALAEATGQRTVADVATQISDLYDEYAGWLVRTAGVLVVDEDAADLVPTVTQRLAGRAKDVVGAPARLLDQVGTSVRGLVGRGSDVASTVEDRIEDTVGAAGDRVSETADRIGESIEDAVTPVRASDLPVPRYDSRTAADAVKAVRALDDVDQVSTVLAYEAQHKDRKTVLDAGDKRVAELVDAGV